jgi:hypothetical protein
MEKRRCAGCRKLFHPRPQSPGQKFCAAAQCQRERKRRWQKARRASDPDYRENDVQANRSSEIEKNSVNVTGSGG